MNETITPTARRMMLNEVIYHQDALSKATWELPPISPGNYGSSYADMMLDPAVSYAVNLLKESILAEPWRIEPADDSRASLAMALDIERNLRDTELEPRLDDALNAIWRGFWPHEIRWRHAQRRFWLDELAAIDPDQIALELDDHMRISAIRSRRLASADQRVPAEKLWMHVHKPSRTRPAGESVLEPAYRAYSSKNRLLQFWGLAIQRFGTPQWMLQIPANTPPARQTSILNTFYAGRLDGVYLVSQDIAATLINPPPQANLTFEEALSYQDAEITRAILLIDKPHQTAGQRVNITGLGLQTAQRATNYRLARISRELAASFTRQVIQPLCRANWGASPAQSPRLALPAPDSDRIALLADPWQKIVAAGIADRTTAAGELGLPADSSPRPHGLG